MVGRERQCRRDSSAVPASSPSSDEETYPQMPHHVALTLIANCNTSLVRANGKRWWQRPGGEDKSGET